MGRTNDEMFSQIEKAESFAGLWALIVRYFRTEGFDAVGYILLDRGNRAQAAALLEHGFPRDVLCSYAALGYGRNDATLRVAMATGTPVLRSSVPGNYQLSREEAWHRKVMDGLGVSETLALPLYGPNGRDALGTLASNAGADVFDRANFGMLHMIAQAAHLKAFSMRPAMSGEGHGLSLREVEILRWVAQGKSNGVIAEILTISTGTVDTYLRRIFEKLEVSDRTSAAVKGVSLGVIRP